MVCWVSIHPFGVDSEWQDIPNLRVPNGTSFAPLQVYQHPAVMNAIYYSDTTVSAGGIHIAARRLVANAGV